MTERHYRSFRPELQVRSAGDGRTIYGIAVPYNAPTRITDSLVEQFARSAFNHQLTHPSRIKLSREHYLEGGDVIGAASVLRDDPAGLYFEARAAKTPKGDETIELVREGALDQVSIMFEERQNRRLSGGIVERVKADLHEIAVVFSGSYGDLAPALGVRSAGAAGSLVDVDDELRRQAEEYLMAGGLPDAPDMALQIRAIELGMPY